MRSRTRPNLGHDHRFYWGEQLVAVDHKQGERDAAAGVAAAKAERFERVAHPVLANPPAFTPFRVIRRYLLDGHLCLEDIGACKSLREAMAICTSEEWRCEVLDSNGKAVSNNWQSLEQR